MSNTHNDLLLRAQSLMDCGPTEMAKKLATNYNTYKAWLYGVNPLPGAAIVAIRLMMELQDRDTEIDNLKAMIHRLEQGCAVCRELSSSTGARQ